MPAQPVVRGAASSWQSAEVERHRRLDHVPRVGVPAGEPRDVAVGELDRRDRVDRLEQLGRGDDAVDVGERVVARAQDQVHLLRVDDEALAQHGVERAVDGGEPLGVAHDLVREEVVVLRAPATRRCCRDRTCTSATSTASAARGRGASRAARARPPRAAPRARAGGRCARARRACRGSGS